MPSTPSGIRVLCMHYPRLKDIWTHHVVTYLLPNLALIRLHQCVLIEEYRLRLLDQVEDTERKFVQHLRLREKTERYEYTKLSTDRRVKLQLRWNTSRRTVGRIMWFKISTGECLWMGRGESALNADLMGYYGGRIPFQPEVRSENTRK